MFVPYCDVLLYMKMNENLYYYLKILPANKASVNIDPSQRHRAKFLKIEV